MEGCKKGGPISKVFISDSIKNRTIKVFINGSEYLYRKQLKQILIRQTGVVDDDVFFIYKEKKSKEWFVVLNSEKAVQMTLDKRVIRVSDNCSLNVERLTPQRVILKGHWLPAYIANDFLMEFFKDYGTVNKVEFEWNYDSKVYSGIREVYLTTDDLLKNMIPHTVSFDNGINMLVTCPGRLPLCLRCHCLGHVRSECTTRTGAQRGTTYADMLRRRAGDTNFPRGEQTTDPP